MRILEIVNYNIIASLGFLLWVSLQQLWLIIFVNSCPTDIQSESWHCVLGLS